MYFPSYVLLLATVTIEQKQGPVNEYFKWTPTDACLACTADNHSACMDSILCTVSPSCLKKLLRAFLNACNIQSQDEAVIWMEPLTFMKYSIHVHKNRTGFSQLGSIISYHIVETREFTTHIHAIYLNKRPCLFSWFLIIKKTTIKFSTCGLKNRNMSGIGTPLANRVGKE